MSFGGLKSGPMLDTVSFESEPPGAEAKTSNGQTCRTPCSLALPVEAPLTVTFTLNGYAPESERLDMVQATGEAPRFGPNPVVVELTPAQQQPRATKKPAAKKPATKRPDASGEPAPMAGTPAHKEDDRSGRSRADDGSTGTARVTLADRPAARTPIAG